MIAGLRGLGLPAAYVSGYLRTIPPPGKPRLQGADASHAWVSVWCGREIGWFGIDPTNAITVGNDHIVLAVGRDFSDVSPIDGDHPRLRRAGARRRRRRDSAGAGRTPRDRGPPEHDLGAEARNQAMHRRGHERPCEGHWRPAS